MLHLQHQGLGHLGAGLVEHLAAAPHPSGPDQLLGLLAAGHQTQIHQAPVEALLAGHPALRP